MFFAGAARAFCGCRSVLGGRARRTATASRTVTRSHTPDSRAAMESLPQANPRTFVEHKIFLPGQQKAPPLDEGLEAKYAVIDIKTKQYKVTKDDLIISDKIEGLEAGNLFNVQQVYMIGTREYTKIGRPYVRGAEVRMQVEEQTKDQKVIIFKKKRRKNYRRKNGFRRLVTILRVMGISDGQ